MSFYSLEYKSSVDGTIFREHCKQLFEKQVELREARAVIITARAEAISTLIGKVGNGSGNISAIEAVNLILALSHAAPTEPGAAFLAREFNDPNTNDTSGNPKPDCGQKLGSSKILNTSAQDCAEQPSLEETIDVLSKQIETLNINVKNIKEQTSTESAVILDGTTKKIVTPVKIRTSTEVGPSTYVLQCDAGEKPNSDGSKCITRCDHDGVKFDPESNECVVAENPNNN